MTATARSRRAAGVYAGLVHFATIFALLSAGCVPPDGPARVLGSLDELPGVPRPERLEEFDQNVRDGFEKRFARLDAVLARFGTESEDAPPKGPAVHEVARSFAHVGDFAFAYRIDDTARVAYANAARLEPMEPRWAYFSGLIAARGGAAERAEAELSRAVRLDPLNDEVVLAWTEQRLAGEELDGVEERLRAVLDLQPENGKALLQLGTLLQRRGREEEALTLLRRALETDPQAGDVRYALAQLLRDAGEIEEAEQLLRGVAVGDGASTVRSPRPWYEQTMALQRGVRFLQRAGEAAYRAGRLQVALARFTEAAELAPENPLPQFNRLLMLIDLGLVDQAIEQRERLRELAPGHRQLLFLSGLLEDLLGNQGAFVRDLRASIAADAAYVSPRLELARWSFRSGDLVEGRAQFEAVLESEPENETARLQWLLAEATFGDPELACGLVPGADAGPMPAQLAVGAARLLATVNGHCGQDPARGLRLARSLYEQDRGVYNAETVAMALFGSGRTEAAVRVQSQIVEQVASSRRPGAAGALERARARFEGYRRGEGPGVVWTEDELRDLGFLSKRRRRPDAAVIESSDTAADGGE